MKKSIRNQIKLAFDDELDSMLEIYNSIEVRCDSDDEIISLLEQELAQRELAALYEDVEENELEYQP